MSAARPFVLAGGVLLVLITIGSVVGTFIVPRDTPARIAAFVARIVEVLFRTVASPFKSYEAKDRILAFQAPWFLIVLLATWLGLLVVGFTLILWVITRLSFLHAMREVGSSMFTLGFATTPSAGATVVDFSAAAAGLSVVALLVGYLPVLYAAFNRRETLVTLLESRAGAPAWGPELLWRHHRVGTVDSLPAFYEEWERWCADLSESHSTYPMLLFFRSPDPLRSWLTGLLAVMDSAAVYLSLCPITAPSQARLCLRMGFVGLRSIADTLGIAYEGDPRPDAEVVLTYEEYMRGVGRLTEIRFPMEVSPEEAWPHFKGWRVNYEQLAMAIGERVVATPGPWIRMPGTLAGSVIPTKRPVDRTPTQPEGTEYTRPGTYDAS